MFMYLLLSIVSIYLSLRTYILLCPKNSPNKYLFNRLKIVEILFIRNTEIHLYYSKNQKINQKN